jgi:RHS repeat-associated protein
MRAIETDNPDAYWTYDNQGRPLTMTYPVVTDPTTGNPTNTAFTYNYENMGRPSTMSLQSGGNNVVNGVGYNAGNQLTSMSYGDAVNGINETRSYNTMNQLTYLGATWGSYPSLQSFSETYNFSSTQNNGQITSVSEGTGETVSYQYDRLKRLISANSSSGSTQTYGYDGFGNMTSRGPGGLGYFNIQANPANNQMIGFNYDGNGNLHVGNWSYDVENRLVSVDAGGGENYIYDPSNKRVYKQNNTSLGSGGYETYYFYGLDGKVIGEYNVGWCCGSYGTMQINRVTESAYFGGKKVWPAVARDRLGSVRGNASAANRPYGENYSAQNTDGFATYYQDSSTGVNYADQRYYNATFGGFNIADRKRKSARPKSPTSWNRYVYVANDPVNKNDPTGKSCVDPNGSITAVWVDNGDGSGCSLAGKSVLATLLASPASFKTGACGNGNTYMNNGTCDIIPGGNGAAILIATGQLLNSVSVGAFIYFPVAGSNQGEIAGVYQYDSNSGGSPALIGEYTVSSFVTFGQEQGLNTSETVLFLGNAPEGTGVDGAAFATFDGVFPSGTFGYYGGYNGFGLGFYASLGGSTPAGGGGGGGGVGDDGPDLDDDS